MIASHPCRSVSWCQMETASWSNTGPSALKQSLSLHVPGKTTTPNFMYGPLPYPLPHRETGTRRCPNVQPAGQHTSMVPAPQAEVLRLISPVHDPLEGERCAHRTISRGIHAAKRANITPRREARIPPRARYDTHAY